MNFQDEFRRRMRALDVKAEMRYSLERNGRILFTGLSAEEVRQILRTIKQSDEVRCYHE